MKKLLTISAVVFLMIFTAGLAPAKTAAPVFPFTGTGDLFSISDTGTPGGLVAATINITEVDGLFYGTIVYGATTIQFSAVRDVNGAFSLNGVVEGTAVPVQGGFVISLQKEPGIKHKVLAVSIEFGTLGTGTGATIGDSFAGVLFE